MDKKLEYKTIDYLIPALGFIAFRHRNEELIATEKFERELAALQKYHLKYLGVILAVAAVFGNEIIKDKEALEHLAQTF